MKLKITRNFVSKLLLLLLACVLFFYLGSEARRKSRWPFGPEHHDKMRQAFDFNGKYAEAKKREEQRKKEEQEAKIAEEKKQENERINKIQGSALHRMRQQLIADIPEGQIHILKETPKDIEFLLLTLRNPAVHRAKLNLENMKVSMTKLVDFATQQAVRGTDVIVHPQSQKVFASFVTVDEHKCASLKVVAFDLETKDNKFDLQTKFHPECVLPTYILIESGGRMVFDDKGHLFLTVGDFGRGYLAEGKDNAFGKVYVLSLKGGTFEKYSMGHRNNQGLYFDKETQKLWASEHGPQGGDEINLLKKGVHYGWPHDTYGIDYLTDTENQQFMANRGSVRYGTHERYEKPRYAFVPSIATGELSRMPTGQWEFPMWRKDYFVAGMSSGHLVRMVIEGERIILSEPIPFGRVRSFEIAPSGRFLISRPDGLVWVTRDAQEPSN